MKTIEERAKAYAEEEVGLFKYCTGYEARKWKEAYNAYIKIVTEQKEIDDAILKAKIVGARRDGRNEQKKFQRVLLDRQKKELIDKACKWLKENDCEFTAMALRKAMEE